MRTARPGSGELVLRAGRRNGVEPEVDANDQRAYLKRPYFGSRRIADEIEVNRKRVQRLMRVMGLEAIYPKPRTTVRCPEHKIYPYLLRNVEIERPNHVWSTDITYIPLRGGYVYLTAVIDWYSRYVLSWRLSNTLDGAFCIAALEEDPAGERAGDFQYGSRGTVYEPGVHELSGVARRGDQHGRPRPGVGQRVRGALWRTVKYEEVYLKDYENAWEAETSLREYFEFYCYGRRHQRLGQSHAG